MAHKEAALGGTGSISTKSGFASSVAASRYSQFLSIKILSVPTGVKYGVSSSVYAKYTAHYSGLAIIKSVRQRG